MRFCLKKTGPFESSFIQSAINKNRGESMIRAMSASIKSISLFTFIYITFSFLFTPLQRPDGQK